MKTITLKLTDNECRVVNNKTKHIMFVERCIEDGSGGVIQVHGVDKFRKFLNDEIIKLTDSVFILYPCQASEKKYQNLKSIIMKLDNKECEKCDGKGYPYQDDNIDCDECYGTGREAK